MKTLRAEHDLWDMDELWIPGNVSRMYRRSVAYSLAPKYKQFYLRGHRGDAAMAEGRRCLEGTTHCTPSDRGNEDAHRHAEVLYLDDIVMGKCGSDWVGL